ncbi:WD40-repeat-containing domain protein [Pilobolus umbonatus]|nr:WD40-repeat-containing domain protein [Pilobolus umbonatus]
MFSKSYPLCHDINEMTRSDDHMDVIIGFSTGDIVRYDPFSCKYVRMNKGGRMVSSAVQHIKWVPGSEDLFMVSFENGVIALMDKGREDQSFNIADFYPSEPQLHPIHPHKSIKHNPISHWNVSKKGIQDFVFSPDRQHVAVIGSDGYLRIIHWKEERIEDIFSSYFGRLICVDWSPDGNYILTGGEDDLVTIWSFHERTMVARCEGHRSWVTDVAFDPWRCDDDGYRFGSVGEDCQLLLWDFSINALQKPKLVSTNSTYMLFIHILFKIRNTTLLSSVVVKPWFPPLSPEQITIEPKKSLIKLFKGSNAPIVPEQKEADMPVFHPPVKNMAASTLQPTTVRVVHADPCVSVCFREKSILTTDRRGKVHIWGRPSPDETVLSP